LSLIGITKACESNFLGNGKRFASGTVRTAALIAAQPSEARPAIEAAVAEAAAPYGGDDGFAVPIVAVLAYGVKPG